MTSTGTSCQFCNLFSVALKLSDWLFVIPVNGLYTPILSRIHRPDMITCIPESIMCMHQLESIIPLDEHPPHNMYRKPGSTPFGKTQVFLDNLLNLADRGDHVL